MIEMSNERMAHSHELQESREATKQDKQRLHESQFDFQVEQAARANKLQMSQIQFRPEIINSCASNSIAMIQSSFLHIIYLF
jgi:hypothetical protein